MYPLVRHFAEATGPWSADMQPAVDSLLVQCQICDLIMEATRRPGKRRIAEIVQELRFACPIHHDAFIVAHGADKVKPKHHQQLHVPDQIELDEGVLWCWAQERKMALAKAAINHACVYTWNSTDFEDGQMARMWNEILRQLDDHA